jgi:hypothetical protein
MNVIRNTGLHDTEFLQVPFVVSGRLVEGAVIEHRSRDLGITFATPALDLNALGRPRGERPPAADMPVREIIDFLDEVGRRLTLNNPYLAEALRQCERINNIPPALLRRSYENLAGVFSREWSEAIVENDVGYEALDGWRPYACADGRINRVRACPPRLVTILAGNAPQVAAMTIVSSAVAKGVSLLKMPSNDPYTATALLRTMADIDPDHPVVRSFSAVYWRGGDEAIEGALYRPQFFDKIVVWGGEVAVRHAQKYICPGLQLVSWDPKTSISMIGREAFASEETLQDVAVRSAVDVTIMNQDACVAARYQFVEGTLDEVDRYCERLIGQLGVERERCTARGEAPPADIRDEVDVLRLLEPEFRVWGDYSGSGLIVRSEDPVSFFPDFRTVNVIPVASLMGAVHHANVATQTVGVYPAQRKAELRDRLADHGAQRIVELGCATDVPPGGPHDGTYELNRLVRWVADEDAPVAR